MKYLLLGGGGFIGRHLTNLLRENGHSVVVVDNGVTSTELVPSKNYYVADCVRWAELDCLIADCDCVYFLAGSVGVKNIVENPWSTIQNNVGLAYRVITSINRYQKPVIFTSTSEVYGDGPFAEDNNLSIGSPLNLRWGYASAKLTTEFMIASAGVPYKILRLFNVVGPGQLGDYGMVLPRFINQAMNNLPIDVYGSGRQQRAFCHVKDALNLILQLENSNVTSGIYNIGTDDAVTILELAHLVKEITGSNSIITTRPLESVYTKNSGDINCRIPDLTKIKNTVNYQINYTISDIIRDMIPR